MTAWPKSLIIFGANLLTVRTKMRLRGRGSEVKAQRRAYRSLIDHLANTSYWRPLGIERGMTYEAFRASITPCEHGAIASAIQRMQQGESGVLWPERCSFFVASGGTTDGAAKLLPVTSAMFEHFRSGCRDVLLYYMVRTGNASVLRGRHLLLTGPTALMQVGDKEPARAYVGELPAIAALNLPSWGESQRYEPDTATRAIRDWQARTDATIARTAGTDIRLIAGSAPWVICFADAMRAKRAGGGSPIDNLRDLWPNLECLLHGSVPVEPYLAELRSALGRSINFHEVYAATEGFFAAQDGDSAAGLRLMADLGLFFEFVPVADFDAGRLEALREKASPLWEAKAGIDYVVLLTSPAGLARYVVGDVVQFVSTDPPRIRYVGRTALQLAAFGERVTEKDVTDALVAVCLRHRWDVINFHVAPLFEPNLTGQARGRHEWWVELKPGTVETPRGPQMAVEIDRMLARLNSGYSSSRASGRIEAPIVRLVMPGVFRHWSRYHHRWDGQSRIARCRSDRRIADDLAQITRFAGD